MGRMAMLHSIVIPVYNEREGIAEIRRRLTDLMASIPYSFEIILVNDGSRDGTDLLLDSLHRADPRFKVLHFSRNFGHQVAITAGMQWSTGTTVTVLDADMQDPPELIATFLEKWREGYEVVYGVRTARLGESRFKRWTASLYYKLMRRLSHVDIPVDTGDFRLMDRKVVDAFLQLRERQRYVRGLVAWLGFRQIGLPYVRDSRKQGETHYPLSKMLRLAWDGIMSFSRAPAMAFVWMGLGGIAASLLSIPAGIQLFATLLLGGLVLAGIGMLGLYLVTLLEETRARPLFVVQRAEGFVTGTVARIDQPVLREPHALTQTGSPR